MDLSSPHYYLLTVLACFVLATAALLSVAWLCIQLCERVSETPLAVEDDDALLQNQYESQYLDGPLSAMRVLSGASLLTALAPRSVQRNVVDLSAW